MVKELTRKMKDSGIEWIGEIPEDWEVQNLKSILEERNEMNNPIKTESILSLTNDRGVIPYSEKGDIGNKSKEDLTKYKLVYPNDIVVNSMNVIIGSVGLSDYFGATSPVYYMLYPRNYKDSVKYYNYLFQTKEFQSKLVGYGNGIMEHRMRIPMMNLNKVHLPYPDSLEQKSIADFLDKKTGEIDKIISKTKEAIEEYKKYKQSLITETVTKGLDKNATMKDSGVEWIGEIPEHWELIRLGFLGRLQNGINKDGEEFGFGHPFINYGDIYRNCKLDKLDFSGLVNSTEKERENYSVKKGDILFTRTSEIKEEIGYAATCLEDIENAVFTGFAIRFRPLKKSRLIPEFSKYYFRSEIHRKYFVKEMNIVTRASLGQELLMKLSVLLPSLKEQKEISNYLDKKTGQVDRIISSKEKLLEEMEAYKKSLIYETVTGKREVK